MNNSGKSFFRIIPGLFLLSFVISVNSQEVRKTSSENTFETMWQRYDSLVSKEGLTASAAKLADSIYVKSKHAGNIEEMCRSLFAQFTLSDQQEEDALVKSIDRLKKELAIVPKQVTPVMHLLLANLYREYYAQNRWHFMQRTQTTENVSEKDIKTWDLKTIFEKTQETYLKALKNSTELKKIPSGKYRRIIINKDSAGLLMRPTLYDVVAHHALDFFFSEESNIITPASQYKLDSSSYFLPCDSFAKILFTTKDVQSNKFYAIKVLQDLILFHLQDSTKDALIDLDLKRLSFAHNQSSMANKDSLYINALNKLKQTNSKHPAFTEIMYRQASVFQKKAEQYSKGDSESLRLEYRNILKICDSAISAFPNSFGAQNCSILKATILSKSLYFEIEKIVLPNKLNKMLVRYKNSTKAYFRLVRINEDIYSKMANDNTLSIETRLQKFIAMAPQIEWNVDLPDFKDYREHSTEVKIPAVGTGFYIVLSSINSSFGSKNNSIVFSTCRFSNIFYMQREAPSKAGALEFFVLNRATGKELANVNATIFTETYEKDLRKYITKETGRYTTNNKGYFSIPSPAKGHQNNFFVTFIKDTDTLNSENRFYQYYQNTNNREYQQTYFFTDRAIYRPGQTIFFKGIMLSKNRDSSRIISNTSSEIILQNMNSEEIGKITLKTNEYGTFNGSFTLPQNVITGSITISNKYGSANLTVEEYKRPKFEVTFKPVDKSVKLNENVSITGLAKAYSGAFIDGAKVKYSVTRQIRFPYWWCFWRPRPSYSNFEIVKSETVTDDTGHFTINFNAIADPRISKDNNPQFIYKISAHVTDINGETHEAVSEISISYTALNLSVEMPAYVNSDGNKQFTIKATNLSGIPQPTTGTIEIYQLESPNHVLPNASFRYSVPDTFTISKQEYATHFPNDYYDKEEDISSWPRIQCVYKGYFNTENSSKITIEKLAQLSQGAYYVELKAKDIFKQEVTHKKYITIFNTTSKELPLKKADLYIPVKTEADVGEKASFIIGTAFKNTRILFELSHNKTIISSKWLNISESKQLLEIPILEQYRGNIIAHLSFVRDNRFYTHDIIITVPWSNKNLSIDFETFRSTLKPGEKEQWKLKITGKEKDKIAAEMVATLYDASLDMFTNHHWDFSINPVYNFGIHWNSDRAGFNNYSQSQSFFASIPSYPIRYYPEFFWSENTNFFTFHSDYKTIFSSSAAYAPSRKAGGRGLQRSATMAPAPAPMLSAGGAPKSAVSEQNNANKDGIVPESELSVSTLNDIKARNNLNETAFFYPSLQTDENGTIIINFTIPEALTKWKLLGLAHTKNLSFGQITKELSTQKELMVVPNNPRFFREHDKINYSAKITNLLDKDLSGSVQLFLLDASTMKPVDSLFKIDKAEKTFTAGKGLGTAVFWSITIPEGISAVYCKVVAKADKFSDGEETIIPVLSNRTLVTETMPLSVNRKGSKTFSLSKLLSMNNHSTTLRNHKLTLEFTSNPAWYAIQALPYLIEYPYECAEQTFARYYANSIASHIANSNPAIKKVFDSWRSQSPDALLSNLEKNKELKSLLLEETPWLLDGKNESEKKRKIALLFDLNKMSLDLNTAMNRLIQIQSDNGAWPWFDNMPDDRYITQYIVTGFGRLKNMNVSFVEKNLKTSTMISKALSYLDNKIHEDYTSIKNLKNLDKNNLSSIHIQYLYARSFFPKKLMEPRNKEASDYFLNQAKKYWLQNDINLQGMIALALHRNNDTHTPSKICKSLKERSLFSEELGRYWKGMYEYGKWFWYQAPIETQALMIETMDEVMHDSLMVDEMKTWLLKSKQTENWKTTRATTDAIYALLLRGSSWLAAQPQVSITLGDTTVNPEKIDDCKVEMGTGYFKTSWNGSAIQSNMGKITVKKDSNGVAWGGVYWQYFEQLDKITSQYTPIRLERRLFRQIHSDEGTKLEPVTEKIKLRIGDLITVRIELDVDRDMEYVHMKDMRASSLEPVNVLSEYKNQFGLSYYESTRDASTNFFFSYLHKGTYMFEYPLYITHSGNFSNGITTIQCMYAPEFTSQSKGIRINVEK
jgi:uncharacterized protein YfaS (alpha-2-macroglobulin family)